MAGLCNSRTCSCAFTSSTISITGNGSPESPYVLEFSDSGAYLPLSGGEMDPGAQISFGFNLGQHIVMFDTTFDYGFGMQTSTMYSRVNAGGEYAWYEGGVHSNTALDPGAGGSTRMLLGEARFGIYAGPTNYFAPTRSFLPLATDASGLNPLGCITYVMGSAVSIIGNGYRNSGGTWTNFGAGGDVGVSMMSLHPTGDITWHGQTTTPTGLLMTERGRLRGSDGIWLFGKATTDLAVTGCELHPNGSSQVTRSTLGFNFGSNKTGAADVNGGEHMRIMSAGTTIGTITRATASTTGFNTSSDEDLKSNIEPLSDELALYWMRIVQPMLFEYIRTPGNQHVGYIAQRIAAAWPESVALGIVTPGWGDITQRTWDDDGNETTPDEVWTSWQVDLSKFTPFVHASLRAVDVRLSIVEDLIAEHSAKIRAMENTLTAVVAVPVIAAALKK